jgi:hypothetical protein
MLFLDKKGIVRFNGANIDIISTPIQTIFERMNVSAARQTATAVHDKIRNQVMFGLPVDGSSTNNLTVVYDYLLGAWTTYEGYSPAVFALAKGRLSNKSVFYGDYNGRVNHFGSSFLADNGVGYTCLVKSRFVSELGQGVQKQFRRLFVNVDEKSGSTLQIKLYQDYGSSVQATRYIMQTPFQSRIDFGLSAKSMSFELSNFSSADTVRLHGWVIHYRFQRNV